MESDIQQLPPLRPHPGGRWPRPNHPPPQRDRLVELKQLMTDRFAHHRLGGAAHFRSYDEPARRAIRRFIGIPPEHGRWPGHPRDPPRQNLVGIYPPQPAGGDPPRGRRAGRLGRLLRLRPLGRRRGRQDQGQGQGGENQGEGQGGMNSAVLADMEEERRLRRVAGEVATVLGGEFRPARYRFRRVLGFGGYGAAFLFEMRDEDEFVLPVVVKADISGRVDRLRDVYKEKENFVAMAGSQHFVQRCVLQSFPVPTKRTNPLARLRGLFSGLRVGTRHPRAGENKEMDDDLDDNADTLVRNEQPADRVQAARRVLDLRRDIIIMEYMSRGNLWELVARLQGKDRLSNRMLWLMFQCLFKGCVAMAYPFRNCPPDVDPFNEQVVAEDETLPRRDVIPATPMVHFDLDPQNALIGSYGLPGEDHDAVPIVKVADPGLADFIRAPFRSDEHKLWRSRAFGKPEFFTPEQFTDEWDYEASRDLASLWREDTAGNYQWWTNLFQAAMVMWCLMTHCLPPDPPVPSPYSYPADDGGSHAALLHGYSYGMILYSAEFGAYDRRLRHLVVRCLDHNPLRRPRMRFLQGVIEANAHRVDLRGREPDEALLRNAQRIFGEPP